MADCVICGATLSVPVHRCRYCGDPVCPDHRLPENHECVYQSFAHAPSTADIDSATETRAWDDARDVVSGRSTELGTDDTDQSHRGQDTDTDQSTESTPPKEHSSGNFTHPADRDTDTTPDPPTSSADASTTHPAEHATDSSRPSDTPRSPDRDTTESAHPGTGWRIRKTVARWYGRMVLRPWRWVMVRVRPTLRALWAAVLALAKLAVVAFAVVGIVSLVQPSLLAPLAGAGLPVPSGIPSATTTSTPTAVAAAGGATATPTATETAVAGDTRRERIENLIHAKVNERRQANGLSPIPKDDTLRQIARSHSQEMAMQGYFAHESPSGETFEDRYEQFGYNCRVPVGDGRYVTGGENIWMMGASTMPSAESVATEAVTSWMNSPGHRKNILRPYWNDMGIGVYILEKDDGVAIYATQNFC